MTGQVQEHMAEWVGPSESDKAVFETIISALLAQDYAICDGFFSKIEVAQLRQNMLQQYQQRDFHQAAIGNHDQEQVVESIRGDQIHWLEAQNANEIEQIFFAKVGQFVQYLKQTCYMGIEESEFHYAVYAQGTFYQKHIDAFQNDDRRTLSMVLYLNEEDWQDDFGGQLALYLPNDAGEEQVLNVMPLVGRLAIFNSKTIPHEVKTVQHTRYSITGWLKTRPMSLHI